MVILLAGLGGLCIFVGGILFIVGGFRVSVVWGLVALFLPALLFFAAKIGGASFGMGDASWWLPLCILLLFLPWVCLMALHWDKAKNGFLMCFAGLVFWAAGLVSADAQSKQQITVWWRATGYPIPQFASDWLGIKPAATTAGKPGSPNGGPDAQAGSGGNAKPADAPTAPVATEPTGLETQEQVLAAVAELNDRATKLRARKELMRGSPDQMAQAQLAEEIKAFNDRLKLVTAREVELKMIPPPSPTPPPAPAIPTTVVIPASTPAPTPTPKKK